MSIPYRRLTQLVPPQSPYIPARHRAKRALTFAFGLLAPSALFAANIAGNPQVAAGDVNFSQQGNIRTIEQQSGAAIINWNDFSIKAGDITRFVQPGVNSAVLNRVLGANPSLLNGRLQANGSVYLINPNGVVVGPQGRIDVGAFFASTLDISDHDFLRGGDLRLHGDSRASVENLGTINATGGDVMLIAYTTRNAGTVSAPAGTVGLAAGSEVLLTEKGDQRLLVRSGVSADKLASGVENSGLLDAARAELKAAGGLYQLAVNQSGIVRATGVETKNGRVLLTADAGNIQVSGAISARNANGSGGEILVGGDYAGQNPAIANAATTRVTASATLDASATSANASGGRVIVWADQSTSFAGSASARAGASGGDGGFIEVSGKRVLDFTGTADTSAPLGKRGTLLLDPDAVIIGTAADQDIIMQGPFIQAQALPSFLNNGTLNSLLAITDVEIRTGDSVAGPAGFNGISVNADLGWTSTSNLKLVSGDTIAINANINAANSGSLTLMPGSVAAADSSTGAVTLAIGRTITVNTLSIEKSLLASSNGADIGAITLAGAVNASVVELVRNSGGVTGDITLTNAANQIGTLRGTGANAPITGALRVNDSAGGLILDGNLSGITGAVEIVTTGNLAVNSGAQVKNTGTADLVLASHGGSFANNAGASAIEASGAGRYLIYSDTPANTTRGGLTGLSVYTKTYAGNAPASITQSGDRFLFNFSPTLTFTADNLSRSTTAANPALTFSVSGLQAGDSLGDAVTGTPALSTTATAGSPAGPYPISIGAGTLSSADMGYGLSFQAGTLNLISNLLKITADNATRPYGSANPSFTASYDGFNPGDTSSIVTGLQFSTTAVIGSNIGNYAITPFGATAPGYSIDYTPGTLQITPVSLLIRPNDLSRRYGAANPSFTASFTGFVNNDTSAVVSGLTLGTTATSASGIGGYPITGSGATATNYDITYQPGTLTINRAPLLITPDSTNRPYGSANPAFTASFSGLVNNDSPAVVSGLSFATTATSASPIGVYPINASGGSAANYALSYDTGTLVIDRAVLTVTPANATRPFGDTNPALTLGGITGFVLGENASVLTAQPTFTTTASLTSNVGNYPVTGSAAAAANYSFDYAPGTLSVTPAPLVVRADSFTRFFGDANPTLTYGVTGLKNGDTADGRFVVSLLGTVATANTSVGNYGILFDGFDVPGDNYAASFQNGTLTISPRPLTITANNTSRTYGSGNPSFSASFSGLASFHTSASIPNLQFSTPATSGSDTGAYPITPFGATTSNYAITYQPGVLTVDPATLTVIVNPASRLYASTNPSFSTTFVGFVNGDDATVLQNVSLGTTAVQSSNVGRYPINYSATARNYTINTAPGELRIDPAFIDVSVGTATRVYGDPNPATAPAGVTGLLLTDTVGSVIGFSSPATASSPVGSYFLTAESVSPNYQIRNLTSGFLEITPRPVTITFFDGSRIFGQSNPAFSFQLGGRGLGGGDTFESVLTGNPGVTTATPLSNVGSYPITLRPINNPNYAFTTVPGTLSVTPRPIQVAANNAAYRDGDPLPAFSVNIIGLPGGVTTADAFPALTFSTEPFTSSFTLPSGVIIFPPISLNPAKPSVSSLINPNLGDNPNYTVTSVTPGVLTQTRNSTDNEVAIALTPPVAVVKPPLAPAEIWAQGSSFGLPPAANGTLLSLIKNQLAFAVAVGETEMLRTLLGDDYAELTKDGVTEAALIAAVAGFHNDKAKQAIILPALLEYVTQLAAPDAKLSATDKQILDAVAPFVAKARDEVVSNVEAAKNQWFAERQAAADAAPIALVSDYTPIYPPYNEFLKIATEDAIARRISNINLGAGLGGAAGGALVGAGTLSAVYTFTAVKSVVFMSKSSAGLTAGLSAGAGTGAAAAIVFVAASAGIVAGTAQTITAAVAENRYNELLEQKGQPVNLTGFNTGEKSKGLIAAALLGMMSGGVSLPPPR